MPHLHTPRVTNAWTVAVSPTLGGSFRPAPQTAIASSGYSPAPAALEVSARLELPQLDLAGPAAPSIPPPVETPAPAPQPQAAERWIALASRAIIPTTIPFRQPRIEGLPISGTYVRKSTMLVPPPRPEAVAREVRAVLDGDPVSYGRDAAMLRFSMHAVEEIAAQPAPVVQAPPPAGARPGPEPMPVESMPAVPAHAPVALPAIAAVALPTMHAMVAQVLPQAPAVDAPAPAAVESMPAVAMAAPEALPAQPALRLPTLAHFQPAEESSEVLAAPMPAAGPVPVESMPSEPAFQALPMPAAPPLAAQAFHPEIHARFDVPRVAGPAPAVAEPPAAQRQPAVLEPVARIAAQPAGSQPQRPVPAIPQPRAFALEYYCQRISSVPVKRIEPAAPRIALVLQPFALRAALGNPQGRPKKKPSRIVLPFEEIFARQKQDAPDKRVRINTWGKIAAAVMVGLALWTGSRIANVSRHTEEFTAQVAASERTVAVAESRSPDPMQADFGKGPVGRVRRAIASRAATEITDTFRTGMAAWGAQQQSWAAGWKHHAQGYVSTGEMALFQPSLKYTDYRMDFYGQIEDKSLGWVVRAQDKKNYYAMKFTVIEPGLRPIIAMVHYGVKNGKAGHKVQTPLSVMVHNSRPMHVTIDVSGNHFTASIDGERIESWTDEAAGQGGVGFFSEPGERARLYWMKLSRNQDMLGRFCAYLSGGRSQKQTADAQAPEHTGPLAPRLPALAVAAALPWNRKNRRREAWSF